MARDRAIGAWVTAAGIGLLLATGLVASGDATANQCASACYAAHNQCRIASKGSPSCDAQLSRCLASCGRR